jgi:glycosyltransferase involved in cell wall biosynthesis
LDIMTRDEKVGIVGSKIVYPDGKLQEAGGIVWRDGNAANYGRGDDPDKPEYNYAKEVDYVSGASLMIRRELWEQIGGFDETFSPAYYEDTDLSFEVRRRGYKVMLQPKSIVVHFEGISHGTDLSTGVKRFQETNRLKFANKWRRTLREAYEENALWNLFHARDRTRERKTMLVIDISVPDYDKHAGSRTIFHYLQLFVNMGFNVKFMDNNAIEHGVKYEPYVSVLEQMGIEVLYGPWYRNNWESWLKERVRDLDYVYLHKPYPSTKYVDIVRYHTKAHIIYNCGDFHYLRMVRQYKITKDPRDLEESRKLKKMEFSLFEKSDLVLTYSEQEKSILSKKMPRKRVRVMPIFFYDEKFPLGQNKDFKERHGIIFVGGFAHLPNVDAVLWLVNRVFPKILDRNPDVLLTIIGSNPPEEILKLKSRNIAVTGFVSDENLDEYYSKSRVVVAPIRFGAGVKGKIIEAVAHCVPVVTTTRGIEGIRDVDGIAKVADREDDFAAYVLEMHENQAQWDEMQKRQLRYSEKYLGMDYARDFIETTLNLTSDRH